MNMLAMTRHLAGLRQRDLAARVGVSRPLISMIETGAVRPTPELEEKLATALGMPAELLFGQADQKKAGG